MYRERVPEILGYCGLIFILILKISTGAEISQNMDQTISNLRPGILFPPVHIEGGAKGIEISPELYLHELLLSPTPTNDEQYMLELVNEARRDPGAFGYPTEVPAPPLYFEGRLLQAARDHTNSMLFGSPYIYFDHDSYEDCTDNGICWSGSSGCNPPPTPSSCSSGYCASDVCTFVESFSARVGGAYSPFLRIGENIACHASVPSMHQGWMDSTGHRRNLMNSEYREIGISYITGGPCGAMGTEDFGNRSGINPSASGAVITGVVYEDTLTPAGKYQAGEGISDATVEVTGPATISETTWGSGGYNVFPGSTGTYTITVTATGYLPNVKTDIEAEAGLTTKVDFIMTPGSLPTGTPTSTKIPASSNSGLLSLFLILLPFLIWGLYKT